MSLTVVIRIDRRDAGEYSGQRSHDHRIGTKEHPIPGYVDQSRTHLNSTFLVAPECSGMHLKNEALKHKARERAALNYAKALKSKDPQSIKLAWSAKQACRQKYSRGDVVAYSLLIGFGYEAQKIIDQLEYTEQDRLFVQAVMDVAHAMDVEVVSLVVHRDETATHCQAQTTAVTFKGSKVRMQPSDCARLQDIGARPFAHLGIKRGIPKAERQSKGDKWNKINHRTVKRLHEDLPREIAQKEQELAMVQEVYQKQQAKLAVLMKEYENAQSLLQEIVAEVERYHNIEGELRAWEEAVAARESNLEREIEPVRLELAEVKRKAELCTGALDELIFYAVQADPDLAKEHLDPYVERRIKQGFNYEEINDAVVGTMVENQIGEACRRVEERLSHDSEQLQPKKSGPKLGF
ncbi:MAG: hypothetical protein AB7D27_16425 [Desulfomicrobium sp.]